MGRLQGYLKSVQSANNEFPKLMEPFALRNTLATINHKSHINELDSRLENLVQNQFILQGGIFATAVLLSSFGAPLVSVVPISVLSSSAGKLNADNSSNLDEESI